MWRYPEDPGQDPFPPIQSGFGRHFVRVPGRGLFREIGRCHDDAGQALLFRQPQLAGLKKTYIGFESGSPKQSEPENDLLICRASSSLRNLFVMASFAQTQHEIIVSLL